MTFSSCKCAKKIYGTLLIGNKIEQKPFSNYKCIFFVCAWNRAVRYWNVIIDGNKLDLGPCHKSTAQRKDKTMNSIAKMESFNSNLATNSSFIEAEICTLEMYIYSIVILIWDWRRTSTKWWVVFMALDSSSIIDLFGSPLIACNEWMRWDKSVFHCDWQSDIKRFNLNVIVWMWHLEFFSPYRFCFCSFFLQCFAINSIFSFDLRNHNPFAIHFI